MYLGSSGLSPRLRGNRHHPQAAHHRHGSIPAPAGEPSRRPPGPAGSRVYPRACGGTLPTTSLTRGSRGLSPRLRGNQLIGFVHSHHAGSIPAPAGEPLGPRSTGTPSRVYPRACGGTEVQLITPRAGQGLSPRLRGNHVLCRDIQVLQGSIPAPAGEPESGHHRDHLPRVYPRACGGTDSEEFRFGLVTGLSPRLRGNRGAAPDVPKSTGSIPAPAGEPLWPSWSRRLGPVYPRACGGTRILCSGIATYCGLSPRLRGNLPRRWGC